MAVLVLEGSILIATHFSSPRGMGNLTLSQLLITAYQDAMKRMKTVYTWIKSA